MKRLSFVGLVLAGTIAAAAGCGGGSGDPTGNDNEDGPGRINPMVDSSGGGTGGGTTDASGGAGGGAGGGGAGGGGGGGAGGSNPDAASGCTEHAECNDNNACTTDTCEPGGTCANADISAGCADNNACTADSCNPGSGCVNADITLSCNDNNACTADSCNPASGCVNADIAATCDDNNLCTADSCDPASGCINADISAACDDDRTCTTDRCEPAIGCVNYVARVQAINPAGVFSNIDQTYLFPNNLVNSIWFTRTNTIVTGSYQPDGYWSFAPRTNNFAAMPNRDTGNPYDRMVMVAATSTVIKTVQDYNAANADQIHVGSIDPETGVLGGFAVASYSDDFNGICNLISASPDEFLCYTGTAIRRYATQAASNVLTFRGTVALSPAPTSPCGTNCYGGTFAWDGTYYYFPTAGGSQGGAGYQVYNAAGAFFSAYTAAGGGNINGTYFDWSIGRYSTHDGYGARSGGSIYQSAGGTDDSHAFGSISPAHCPGACQQGAVCLTDAPDPSTVFNTIAQTYFFPNNLVNSIWHVPSNRIVTGGGLTGNGYWSFAPRTSNYPAAPNNDAAGNYDRLVLVPATSTVVRSANDQYPSAYNALSIGVINPTTGALSGFQTPTFGDGFTGSCNLMANSAHEFLCFDGTQIRHYATATGNPQLVRTRLVSLSQAPTTICDTYCFGGMFAWDGAYYYFARYGNGQNGTDYEVFAADGQFVATYTAAGGGGINAVYFDWSAGRYATHDGFGARSGGDTYGWLGGGGDDSQAYGPASPYHR